MEESDDNKANSGGEFNEWVLPGNSGLTRTTATAKHKKTEERDVVKPGEKGAAMRTVGPRRQKWLAVRDT